MKRRKFLGLFGGAIAAPLLPMPAVAAPVARAAPYSAAALHGAIYHAQSRAVFSVWGLARAVNLPLDQAEALMADLAKRGVVGPLQGTTYGGRWASSKIMRTDALGLGRAARNARPDPSTLTKAPTRWDEPDLGRLLAHLRQLCRANGIAITPRAAALA